MIRSISFACLTSLAALLAATPALAEPTLELRVSGAKEVFPGDPVSTSVDARGEIGLGPVRAVLQKFPKHPVVTLVAGARDVYVGTSAGGVIKVGPGGKTETLMPAKKAVVSALALGGRSKGTLYAATGPEGAVHAIDLKTNKVRPYFDPSDKYIWALLEDQGGLILATGKPARVVRVGADGKSRVLFKPDETHVRALIRHPKRGIIAGGGDKGIVYQLSKGKKGAYALYDSAYNEVTALAVDPKTGDLYAAFVSESKKGAIVPDKTIGPVSNDPKDDGSPISGSEVVRIASSGRVDLVWSSRRDGALALAFDGESGRLHIATGTGPKGRGRLYAIDTRDRDRLTLVSRVEPPVASAIVRAPTGRALLVGTAPAGRLVRFGPGTLTESVYVSAEQDLQRSSRLGRVWFDADTPSGTSVALQVRTGNTARHDATWSDWTAPAVRAAAGGVVKVPEARYAQFRATLRGSGRKAPRLKSMHASVIRMNVAPRVTDVFVLSRGVYMRPMPPEEEKEKTITVSRSAVDRLREGAHRKRRDVRARQGRMPGMLTTVWRAQDPNGDELLFRLQMRNLDTNGQWRTLSDDLPNRFFSFDSRAYPDGRYQLRVIASDRPSNAPDRALTDRNDSEPFVIDNAPPSIDRLRAASASSGRLSIEAAAKDGASQLDTAEVSINGGPWVALPATDGLVDARKETFALELATTGEPGEPKVDTGKNTVAVRIEDTAGNSATRSTTVVVK